jgi:predicted kinase
METFITYITKPINEGANDPSIFKALFMAGGPGSGKSFIANKAAFHTLGLQPISSDVAFEHQLKKAGLTPSPEDIASEKGQALRDVAKKHTDIKSKGFMTGRLGMAIDGTGSKYDKVANQKKQLEKLGYDTAMVFVNTSLQTALERNRKRPRSLRDELVVEYWHAVQKNLGAFQNLFGEHLYIIDNNDDSDVELNTTFLFKKIRKWSQEPSTHPYARNWVKAHSKKK